LGEQLYFRTRFPPRKRMDDIPSLGLVQRQRIAILAPWLRI